MHGEIKGDGAVFTFWGERGGALLEEDVEPSPLCAGAGFQAWPQPAVRAPGL